MYKLFWFLKVLYTFTGVHQSVLTYYDSIKKLKICLNLKKNII